MKKKSILTLIMLILSGCCLLFSIMTMMGNDDPGSTERVAERNIGPASGDNTTVSSSGSEQKAETTSGISNTSSTKNTEGTGNTEATENTEKVATVTLHLPDDVPEYSGKPFYTLSENVPLFSEKEKASTDSFENYSDLDILGRAGVAFANLSPELLPTEERGPIGQIRPSGWHTVKYNDLIDGNYLYNRCHLIAYSLAGENANEKNLITGTRYLNVDGMQPFEEKVMDYISRTGNHVLYRVTPVYAGNNPLASGVEMEAWSVEDQGKGVSFHVYCYNVQPGIVIDYTSGDSKREDGKKEDPEESTEKTSEAQKSSERNTENTESPTTKKTENTTESQKNTTQSTEKPSGGLVPDSGKGKTIDPGEETTSSDPGDRSTKTEGQTYILNTNTKRIHRPTCSSVSEMKKKNRKEVNATIEELKEKGYVPCKRCLKGY
jgi:DNA-entry nuclease